MLSKVYQKINLLLPTRKRVRSGGLPRYIRSAMETADPERLVITFLVDADDWETLDYLNHTSDIRCPFQILIQQELRHPHLGKFYNRLYCETRWTDEKYVVSMTGDDMIFVTPGWDRRILDAINRYAGLAIVYGDDDLWQHERMCVNLFTSRTLVTATGRPFMNERFAGDYLDTMWYELGRRMNFLCYLSDVVIKHDNYYAKPKYLRDETNRRLQRVIVRKLTAHPLICKDVDEAVRNLRACGIERRLKVIQVMGSLVRGGAEKLVTDLSRYLLKTNYDVNVVAVNGDGTIGKDLDSLAIPHTVLFSELPVNLKDMGGLKALWRLLRMFRKVKPDVVVGHVYHAALWTALAAWLAGVPRILSARHCCGLMRETARLPQWLEWLERCLTDQWIAVSQAVARYLETVEKIPVSKIKVIFNGVEIPEFDPQSAVNVRSNLKINASTIVVGMVANFLPHKNQLMLVRAAREVIRRYPNALFILAGRKSPYCELVVQEIDKMGISDYFRLYGEIDDLSVLLPAFDIGILCSKTEGLGNFILECMAYGKPVIATRVDGIPEVVEDGKTGFLVEKDDLGGLSNAILRLLLSPNLRERMGSAGRQLVYRRFGWGQALKAWQEVLKPGREMLLSDK